MLVADAQMEETMKTFALVVGGSVAFFAAVPFILQGFVEAVDGALLTFEIVMKDKYPERWVVMEKQLEGLDQGERGTKLFAIMDQLKQDEPDFMKQVEDEMRENVDKNKK